MELVTYFDPAPAASELPVRCPSPFGAPHAIARRAAAQLYSEVRTLAFLDAPGGGKMFGVLVVRAPDGRVGFLRAFSGMLDGRWHAAGFVPPAFDVAERDAVWPAGEAELDELSRRLEAIDRELAIARTALAAIDARHEAELAALRDLHRANRTQRRAARTTAGASHALDQESRADGAERKRLLATHAAERSEPAGCVARLDARREALEHVRADRSRHFTNVLYDTYAFANARGERRPLRALFAPESPPGGAGDCAAPKLFAYAYTQKLEPIAIAEVWCGASPATGGRHAGELYPACRGKCGPILAHVLDGLDAEPPPVFGATPVGPDEPRVVFEDDWLVIVDKPIGLLSVPGRHAMLRDSVLVRLRERYPHATGPLVVHRLDLDTSGLLLAAKDADTYEALQRLFACRAIDKRYIAWLEGAPAADAGVVELALRVDIDDRPRQLHDPVHGKRAVTEWRVLARDGERTKVALLARTGRTHQLRVHAAHPLGLGAPIIGDRLYGRVGARLMLHAEALAFVHPHTGRSVVVERPAPF